MSRSILCLLALVFACSDDTEPRVETEEPDAALPVPSVERQGGCTIHWLGEANSRSIAGVAPLPRGRFLVVTNGWDDDRVTTLETFDATGDRGEPLPSVDGVRYWTRVVTDSEGQVWLLGNESGPEAWCRLDGETLVRVRELSRGEYTAGLFVSLDDPGRSPAWSVDTEYGEYGPTETLQHHAADGAVDWTLLVGCPDDAQNCRVGQVHAIGDHAFVLFYTWSETRGIVSYADGFHLRVARKDVGWVTERDLTEGPILPSGLSVADDDELWLLGSTPDDLHAAWARVDVDGEFGPIHRLNGPAECMHNSMSRRRPFDGGALLTGSTCSRYDHHRTWFAAIADDESVRWERHLALMNSTVASIAWDEERRFVLAGDTQNCCSDAPAGIPYVVITDPDAACLDDFAPALPRDPWDE